MRKKALLVALIVIAVVSCYIYVARQDPKVQEVREASMMKFLYFYLEDYGAKHGAYPKSIEEGIKNGLLDDFPEDRNRYLQQAMNEGRFDYVFSDTGSFRIQLITNLNREIVYDGQTD